MHHIEGEQCQRMIDGESRANHRPATLPTLLVLRACGASGSGGVGDCGMIGRDDGLGAGGLLALAAILAARWAVVNNWYVADKSVAEGIVGEGTVVDGALGIGFIGRPLGRGGGGGRVGVSVVTVGGVTSGGSTCFTWYNDKCSSGMLVPSNFIT